MNKKFLLYAVGCMLSLNILAQSGNTRGASALQVESETGTIRALIVGVSSYKNLPQDKQLQYADDDARSFYEFLVSRPDIIDPDNILYFPDTEASNGDKILKRGFYSLLRESQPDDLVLFYFAGHGDIQNMGGDDPGFLLLSDVENNGDYYMMDGAIEISEIQKLAQRYAANGIKVMLIFDACHAGKLVSDNESASMILESLNENWAHIFKLVSCQPNQLSHEGSQYGGGHGVFTYYLLYGLKGLAEEVNWDDDEWIDFGELAEYTKNKVRRATKGKQAPQAHGDEGYAICTFDEQMKEQAMKQMKNEGEGQLLAMNSRGGTRATGAYFYDVPPKYAMYLDRFQRLISRQKLISKAEQTNHDFDQAVFNPKQLEINESKQITGHHINAWETAVSPDGSLIATCGEDNMVKLWQASNEKFAKGLAHNGVMAISFSPDGRFLVSGGWFNDLKIWNLKDYGLVKKLKHGASG